MKDFDEYKEQLSEDKEKELFALFTTLMTESKDTEINEKELDDLINNLVEKHTKEGVLDWDSLNIELTNEGIMGSVLGGIGGFALGKTVGKLIAKVLGVEKGILYDLFTSRLVGAALGASLGKKLPF